MALCPHCSAPLETRHVLWADEAQPVLCEACGKLSYRARRRGHGSWWFYPDVALVAAVGLGLGLGWWAGLGLFGAVSVAFIAWEVREYRRRPMIPTTPTAVVDARRQRLTGYRVILVLLGVVAACVFAWAA